MPLSRRSFLARMAIGLTSPYWLPLAARASSINRTSFKPTWGSLQGYVAPPWFRDAKFGIWAHWSAQCVPEQGDWYARSMYMQGEPQYEYHCRTFGHPSRFGFMEIDNLWKAEQWDPNELMRLYKAAGAKYFVALANHHDNFDTYDSTHHAWNSLNVGPRKDIVGGWAKAAREHGLRFGVSNHSAHAWHWFQTAYGYDGEGPLEGVRYDAARLAKADGIGTWWEGLDPQELYTGPNMVLPEGIRGAAAVKQWHEQHDGIWMETPSQYNPQFARQWFLRCKDLLDKYQPDLLYFDDSGLPLGQTGLDIAAYFYNANRQWNGGRLEGVLNAKKLMPEQRHALVEDIERGGSDAIRPLPWQTDTCIGDWHYSRARFEAHSYKSAGTVITSLCDIVSKNGNLLLSIPLRGNGTIDSDERHILEELAAWMSVNGEAIFGTQPWRVFGEGPTKVASGMFGENNAQAFTAGDIRFTTKGDVLFAITLGRPTASHVTLKSLASNVAGTIDRVEMLGSPLPLRFKRDVLGLTLEFPQQIQGKHAFVFKLMGHGLTSAT
ncbi:alpha-L-fucosidase [Dyella tabacisoli]|uniref:alpha-L-fucosidase n=1 Tax=Dyella tabacisoli TaxID=2282381 RepID=A0A369UJ67_9GAMM|nr:alpha-L-fucosidase [Dyella tabacisoli]RDD80393.1 alpha-L-fucosidase [Dyella tabacisoli]